MNIDSLSIGTASTNSYVSEEDTMEVHELPKFPKSFSSHLLVPAASRCTRNHSFSSLVPQNQIEEKQIMSSYVASNLRRSQSSTSYHKTKFSVPEPDIDKRRPKQLSISNRNNNLIFPSKSNTSDSESLKGLSRKSSFSYVPSSERISRTNSSVNDIEMNMLNLNTGNSCQKKNNSRAQETNRNPSINYANAKLREPSLTGTSRINLRDSAIDLVSDEESSEVYNAVSLAGTMKKKNVLKAKASLVSTSGRHTRKFFVIIGMLSAIIILLGGLAVALALILFKE